jgi:hypothetical protein
MTTFEQTKAELEALEEQLAEKYSLHSRMPVQQILLALDQVGELEDCGLAANWRATFARFLQWAEPEEGWEQPDLPLDGYKTNEVEDRGRLESGLSAFVPRDTCCLH